MSRPPPRAPGACSSARRHPQGGRGRDPLPPAQPPPRHRFESRAGGPRECPEQGRRASREPRIEIAWRGSRRAATSERRPAPPVADQRARSPARSGATSFRLRSARPPTTSPLSQSARQRRSQSKHGTASSPRRSATMVSSSMLCLPPGVGARRRRPWLKTSTREACLVSSGIDLPRSRAACPQMPISMRAWKMFALPGSGLLVTWAKT